MSTPLQQFTDYWAVILGGSSGFGFAAAEKLAMHGMNIAVLYRETAQTEKLLLQKFEKIASENKVQILSYNINALEETGRKKFIEKFTKTVYQKNCVRLLLHSIARGNVKPLTGGNPEDLLTSEDLQLTTYSMSNSLLDWARLFIQENLFCKHARIIGLTSDGANKYWEGYAAVSVAKASLKSLVTYMAVEFAKYGLTTNLLQAGITETPSMMRIPGSEKLVEYATSLNPSGRMTTTNDVADVIYLLCTDEAAWINGALIHVDGGEHCR